MKLQPAVKKETVNVAVISCIGTILMCAVFLILHLIWPEKIPFNWKVLLSGLIGALVATGNFFLMALTVQKITETEDVSRAKKKMQTSYNYRLLLMAGWVVLAFLLPCFVGMAGLIPILIPGTFLKLRGAKEALKKPVESAEKSESAEALTETPENAEEPDHKETSDTSELSQDAGITEKTEKDEKPGTGDDKEKEEGGED